MKRTDVVIVGGGMVGLTLALGLNQQGFQVQVIEQQAGEPDALPPVIPSARVSALHLASRRLLTHLGVWSRLARQTPFTDMQVWERDGHGRLQWSAAALMQTEMGHIVENEVLVRALLDALSETRVEIRRGVTVQSLQADDEGVSLLLDDGTFCRAALLVAADGAHSPVRRLLDTPMLAWDYGHTAVVATLRMATPHQQCARQLFTPAGPLALLPLSDPHWCSLVWSLPPDEAAARMALDDQAFAKAVAVASDHSLGLCEVLGPRQAIPLRARFARQLIQQRCILMGDAAHTIHPLAGQGVNLGLMDVAALMDILYQHRHDAPWPTLHFLDRYVRWRKSEAAHMLAAMEGIKQLFALPGPLAALVRQQGMQCLNQAPWLTRGLLRQAMGLAGDLPGWLREVEL